MRMIECPVCMRAKILDLSVRSDVDTQSHGWNVALHIFQRTHQLQPLTVHQSARLIHHSRELQHTLPKHPLCPFQTIPTHRTLLISACVNRRVATGTYRHAPFYILFCSQEQGKSIDDQGKRIRKCVCYLRFTNYDLLIMCALHKFFESSTCTCRFSRSVIMMTARRHDF